MKTIDIDGEQVQISTQPSDSARSIDIEFKPGEITIKIPRGQQIDLETLLTRRRDLITRKYREATSKIRLLEGDTIHIRGEPKRITTETATNPRDPRVTIEGEKLTIQVRERENPSTVLKRWITQQTQNLIQETLERHREKLETLPEKTRTQDTPRWGHCNKRGEIIYNWQLYALPPDLAEYVIIHEAVHLQHFHHQTGFHRKLESILPDHRQREKELRRHLAIPPNFQYNRGGGVTQSDREKQANREKASE